MNMTRPASVGFRPLLLAAALCAAIPSAFAAVPKDMLVIGKAADPQTLDPAVTIDNNDWTVTYPAYQRLVKYKTDNGKGSTDVEGDLAEKLAGLRRRQKPGPSLCAKARSLPTARR